MSAGKPLRRTIVLALSAVLAAGIGGASAGDVEKGKAKAVLCVACHGAEGKGDRSKGAPDLTGQPPGYLLNQMLLFKADTRSPGDPALTAQKALLKAIPDPQLADIAAWWASRR